MTARAVFFVGPRQVQLRAQPAETLLPGGLRVRTEVSAISAGTEMLVYRGELEEGVALDTALQRGTTQYPLRYGYSAAGRVVETGSAVDRALLGTRVFGFYPHQEELVGDASSFVRLPEGLSLDAATLLANLETAVSLVMDGAPLVGERVAVLGQGVVGQLTAALLLSSGLECVHVIDHAPARLEQGLLEFVPHSCALERQTAVTATARDSFDLVYELTGQPEALNDALALARYEGRVVVGSWYGNRPVQVDLGTRVHRNRNTVLFSQVSRIDARHSGRFDKARRLEVALNWLTRLKVEKLVSHRFAFEDAAQAFAQVDSGDCLQVLLTHAR